MAKIRVPYGNKGKSSGLRCITLVDLENKVCILFHVYAKNINRISTIIPSQELIDLFMEKVKPLYEEIKVLKQKNEILTKQRDSLLPRLMSGTIDLEDKEVI